MANEIDGSVVDVTKCRSCQRRTSADSQFCSNCGARLSNNPDNADWATLTDRVANLEKELTSDHTHEWSWALLDEGDRWRVWWGVFWRGSAVYASLVVILQIIQTGSG